MDLAVVAGRKPGDGGIPQGQLLIAFAEAVLGDDEARLLEVRNHVCEQLGPEALVDAAAVIAGFNAVDRIADATGIPLDENMVEGTRELRSELGLDEFAAAKEI